MHFHERFFSAQIMDYMAYLDYGDYFDIENWWSDVTHFASTSLQTAGPTEIAVGTVIFALLGLTFMRGFQIR